MTLLPEQEDPAFTLTSSSKWSGAVMVDIYQRIEAIAADLVARRGGTGLVFAHPKLDPDGSSLKPGDVVALKYTTSPEPLAVLADATSVGAGAKVLGVCTANCAPGNRASVAVSGLVAKSVTGLTAGSDQHVVLDTSTGRTKRLASTSLTQSDIFLGYATADGDLLLRVGVNPSATFSTLQIDALAFAKAQATPTISHPSKDATAASQAGADLAITAQHATAGTSSAGAARGADVAFYAGNAARLTSGDARGGNLTLGGGAGVGTGVHGTVVIQPNLASTVDGTPLVVKNRSGSTKFYVDSSGIYSPVAAFDALTAKYVSGAVRANVTPTSATLTTADATPTTILTYTPVGKHGVLRFSGSAIDTATDRVKSFEKIVAFKVIAGVATVGTEKNLFDDSGTDRGIINAPMAACTMVSSAVGANIVFTFTGIAATIESFIAVEEISRT